MAMDLVLPITALVLASAIEASKASHTTLARGMLMPMLMLLLMLMPMPMLMLTMVIMDMVLGLPITQTVLPGTLDMLPAMLVALSLVILVSIMARGLLMLMPTLMLMPMLTMVCMDMEGMDMGIQVAIPMWLVLPTTVLMLMALAHTE